MAEAILDPLYWKRRLKAAPDESLHHAIFKCPLDRWKKIELKHTKILNELIRPTHSILDVGCGYGRLLSLMRESWKGGYLGVDLSPDFLDIARIDYPSRRFVVADLTTEIDQFSKYEFDWAVMISIRPMIKRNLGDLAWIGIETKLKKIARRMLYLEYDENDNGSIE